MAELVRRLIHEKRTKTERRPKPSEAFARHFGEDHGIELPPPIRYGYRQLWFSGGEEGGHRPATATPCTRRCPPGSGA